jgi:hypothetical protein
MKPDSADQQPEREARVGPSWTLTSGDRALKEDVELPEPHDPILPHRRGVRRLVRCHCDAAQGAPTGDSLSTPSAAPGGRALEQRHDRFEWRVGGGEDALQRKVEPERVRNRHRERQGYSRDFDGMNFDVCGSTVGGLINSAIALAATRRSSHAGHRPACATARMLAMAINDTDHPPISQAARQHTADCASMSRGQAPPTVRT